ncbi:MAG: arginine transporter [Shimia sp.]
MRALLVGAVAVLVGCGGPQVARAPGVAYAEGPIQAACLRSDRDRVSRPLCGCIQAVADQSLNGREQQRAAEFFRNPQLAQDTRQADGRASEAFWDRYKAFAARAERTCRPVS